MCKLKKFRLVLRDQICQFFCRHAADVITEIGVRKDPQHGVRSVLDARQQFFDFRNAFDAEIVAEDPDVLDAAAADVQPDIHKTKSIPSLRSACTSCLRCSSSFPSVFPPLSLYQFPLLYLLYLSVCSPRVSLLSPCPFGCCECQRGSASARSCIRKSWIRS